MENLGLDKPIVRQKALANRPITVLVSCYMMIRLIEKIILMPWDTVAKQEFLSLVPQILLAFIFVFAAFWAPQGKWVIPNKLGLTRKALISSFQANRTILLAIWAINLILFLPAVRIFRAASDMGLGFSSVFKVLITNGPVRPLGQVIFCFGLLYVLLVLPKLTAALNRREN